MKKIIVMLFALTIISASYAQTLAVNNRVSNPFNKDNAVFNWSETAFDFGKIKLNVPASHQFTFVNKGSAPLIISSVQASCGCTVTEYSKDPIAPGQSGFVKATYNAAKAGVFTKTVTINANTDDTTVLLTIKGEVVAE
jgi:hypothetical protein